MASFVIHNIAGEKFLSVLEDKCGIYLNEEQKMQFLLGNLIADSSKIIKKIPDNASDEELKILEKKYSKLIQEEKHISHFRNNNELDLIIQTPRLFDFIEKYQNLITKDLTVIGYFFHLYTDKMFFEDLFLETLRGLDKDGKTSIYIKEINSFEVLKNNKKYPAEELWDINNEKSVYHDYTKMNKILLEHYGSLFDKENLLKYVTLFINPGIEEVDYSNIGSIINQTDVFIRESYNEDNSELHVFDEELVKNFINVVVNQFIFEYLKMIELVCENVGNVSKMIKKKNL